MSTKLSTIVHPNYDSSSWSKWRLAYRGGRDFVGAYLKSFSARESDDDLETRASVTPSAAFAKAAIDDIKNAIFQRICDVTRRDGSPSYMSAVNGENAGVDLNGHDMNYYVGTTLLPELLVMGRVGVYVDMPQLSGGTLADVQGKHPYVYHYPVEDIRSWSYAEPGNEGEFEAVLLQDHIFDRDLSYNLPSGKIDRQRLVWRDEEGVKIQFYNMDDKPLGEPMLLGIEKIPFVMLEIPASLMVDVADYQIALMNLGSADISYALKACFGFYVEQYDPKSDAQFLKPVGNQDSPGAASTTDIGHDRETITGTTKGRRYPVGVNPPGFIHPSAEPLRASMEKQEQMKDDVRTLVNLAVSSMKVTRASAESKEADNQGLESGLSFIGLVLEGGERLIAEHWAAYEKSDIAMISYPKNYSVRTEGDRQKEAKSLQERLDAAPSLTFQREISKRIAYTLLSTYVTGDIWQKITSEIDEAEVIVSDAKSIDLDLTNGLVGSELASVTRGYPKGEVAKAKIDHAERLALIKDAQSSDTGDGQARGILDTQVEQETSSEEKINKPKRGEEK